MTDAAVLGARQNLPDDLLRALRKAADKDRRRVTQEIIHLLESALGMAERPLPRSAGVIDRRAATREEVATTWVTAVELSTKRSQTEAKRLRPSVRCTYQGEAAEISPSFSASLLLNY
jgi:plasmid stability protein